MHLLNKFIILSLILNVSSIYANDRESMSKEILKAMAIDKMAEKAIGSYVNETMRLYDLDREFLNKHFTDIFKRAEIRYLESFTKGLDVYSDDELSKLLEFYQSEFGKWYLRKAEEFNSKSLEHLPNMMKNLNEEFAQRIEEVLPAN